MRREKKARRVSMPWKVILQDHSDQIKGQSPGLWAEISSMFSRMVVVVAAFVYFQVGCFEALVRNNANSCGKFPS